MKTWSYAALIAVLAAGSAIVFGQKVASSDGQHVAITFSGGHETDGRDRGRPVALIAAALGVPDQVFRDAFSHVRPAPAGTRPDPAQVRQNKDALLSALGRFGITNDRLDEVSNYYRYRRDQGEMWPTVEAEGYAVVAHGKVVKFVITNPGSGYSSTPKVTIPGFTTGSFGVTLSYSRDLAKNGSVASITPPR